MHKLIVFSCLLGSFLVYSAIVYTRGTENIMCHDKMASEGKLLFQKYNCISCHQVYGLGGFLGADLTNVISCDGKGEEYARVFIEHGTDRMPDFHLTKNEVSCLIAYLKFVDQTAITYKN